MNTESAGTTTVLDIFIDATLSAAGHENYLNDLYNTHSELVRMRIDIGNMMRDYAMDKTKEKRFLELLCGFSDRLVALTQEGRSDLVVQATCLRDRYYTLAAQKAGDILVNEI